MTCVSGYMYRLTGMNRNQQLIKQSRINIMKKASWSWMTLLLLGAFLQSSTGGRSSGLGSKVAGRDDSSKNGKTREPWPGHLEPLGAKAIKRAVPVLDGFPSPKTFYMDHILGSLPVVFRNGAKLSPAFKSWTDQGLKLRPGSATTVVDVEIRKKENRKLPTQRMTLHEFLDRYQQEDEYMVDTVPTFLRKDVVIPPPLVCDDVLKRIADVVMWFSSGGTKSVLHNDDTDNINCLFSGQKEVLFINYTQYRHQVNLDHPEGSYSSVDVEKVDMDRYPGLRNVEFYQAKMFPGDCIYIPYKWMHQVNSLGRNLAVNVWWDHSCDTIPSPEVCGAPDRRLTVADIQLGVEQPLDFVEDFEEDAPSPYEDFLKTLMKDKEAHIFLEDFTEIMKSRVPILNDLEWNEECDDLAKEAFDLLDKTEDDVLDSEDFTAVKDMDDMQHFQVEAKLLMLSDIAHEQEAQKLMRAYEIEKKKNPRVFDDSNTFVHQVEPLDLDDIDWGSTDETKKEEEKKETANKQEKQIEKNQEESTSQKSTAEEVDPIHFEL